MNAYEILDVEPDASPEVIDAARVVLSRRYHPDVGTTPDHQMMAQVNAAYETLSDPAQRAQLDAQLGLARPGAPGAAPGMPPAPPPPPAAAPGPPSHPYASAPPAGASPGPVGAAGPPPPTLPTGGGPAMGPGMGAWGPTQGAGGTNSMAVWSFWITLLCFPPLGVILAVVARGKIKNSGGLETGIGWTTATFILFAVQIAAYAYMVSTASPNSGY